MKIKIISLLLYSIIFLQFSVFCMEKVKPDSDLRLFIKTPDIKTGVSAQFAADFTKRLALHFFETGGYRVLDENDIKIIYQEAETLLALGCDADQCIMQIAHAINADEVVYGSIEKPAEKIHIYLQLLKKDNKTDKMAKQSIVDITFFESQTDWYSNEIVEKLVNPGYVIDDSKAPIEVKITPKLEPIVLKEIKQEDIKPITFRTDDESVNMIIDVIKNLLLEGDNLVNQKDYSGGISKYEDAISRIETKLTTTKQEKLISLKNDIFNRIANTQKSIFNDTVKTGDKYLSEHKYSDAVVEYDKVITQIAALRNEISELMKPYRNQIEKRIHTANENIAKYLIKEGDQNYNEYKFRETISLYEDALNKLTNKTKTNYKEIAKKVKNKYPEYNDMDDLDLAKRVVEKYPEYKEQVKITEKEIKFQLNLEKKIEIAKNTEREYLKNKVKAYCDKIEVLNVKNEDEKAKDTFLELNTFIKTNPQCSEYAEIDSLYKEICKVMSLNEKDIEGMVKERKDLLLLSKYKITEPIVGEKIVLDKETDLMWIWNGNLEGRIMTLDEAMKYCEDLNYAGYNDWRLPTIEELETIVKRDERPTINNNAFDSEDFRYWSAYVPDKNFQSIDFNNGFTYIGGSKTDSCYVRPVRGGK